MTAHRRLVCPTTNRRGYPSFGSETDLWELKLPRLIHDLHHNQRSTDKPTGRQLPPSFDAGLGSPCPNNSSFLKDPLLVLEVFFLDISNLNTSFYKFRTSHINFIQNKHVKLDETYQGTQGHFEANLSNVMDV